MSISVLWLIYLISDVFIMPICWHKKIMSYTCVAFRVGLTIKYIDNICFKQFKECVRFWEIWPPQCWITKKLPLILMVKFELEDQISHSNTQKWNGRSVSNIQVPPVTIVVNFDHSVKVKSKFINLEIVARWSKAWYLDTRGFILKKIQWHIHTGSWSLVNCWREALMRHYIRCSWILMNAAVGLMDGLGLDGDRCIRVIPRQK